MKRGGKPRGTRRRVKTPRPEPRGSYAKLRIFALGGVPNREDDDALSADAVQNDVRSAANDQLADTGFRAGAAQVRLIAEGFHDSDDAHGEAFRGDGLILRDKGADFLKAGSRQGRPDNFYRHRVPPSCTLPQTHFGGGSSRRVPHESSQAFMALWGI